MWTTKLIDSLEKDQYQVINDSKTPSGRVHVGSLRGVLIHDAVYREVKHRNLPGIYIYGVDDYDPMDGLPADAPEDVREHMGKPLCNVPTPAGLVATDMADHYISEFLAVFRELAVDARIYRMRDVYRGGLFNEVIDTILRNAHRIRAIYEDISGAKRPDHWHPFQVICENCGKIGTTEVSGFDGEKVRYHCKPDLVTWAVGCGHQGEVSPFDGHGKLPWKLEWAAKWHEFGITIEGAGKDHCTKGGSRDVASRIMRELFGGEPPVNIPYEFFLVEGTKMSSSKGVGSSARDMADFLPPEILRFLMVKTDPKKAVNFSTDGAYMLKTFNEHDRLLERLAEGDITEDQSALLRGAKRDASIPAYTPVSFQLITSLLQIPHVDLHDTVRSRMGRTLTEVENHYLAARIAAARYWLANIAPEEDKFEIRETLPAIAGRNASAQQHFIASLRDRLSSAEWREDLLQTDIFDAARLTPLPAKQAFEAIYRLFLGKESGPRAGALLSYLDRAFVIERLETAISIAGPSALDFIGSVGISQEAFIQQLETGKFTGTIRQIVPEVYGRTASEMSLNDDWPREQNGAEGVCALKILSEDKNRLSATRVIMMAFGGDEEIGETGGKEANAIRRKLEERIATFCSQVTGKGISLPVISSLAAGATGGEMT
uniref:Lysine--tRNA ligase n=1 Tax=Candidatus Kentrum eta TaxID=2126337 RepID=A0A450VGM1_9GAMM|nr:MAG: lysyl-tRNA synthetase, class I [Candidatus Kentron sp. H]VFK03861.1 MAG: lysyl-tRNA synthetase, class I [Candidatus Kentron sp. H]VFK06404.1 MAG: lysyl-tRNA synthetase, class I [Candidatus Kentron sp. H]